MDKLGGNKVNTGKIMSVSLRAFVVKTLDLGSQLWPRMTKKAIPWQKLFLILAKIRKLGGVVFISYKFEMEIP